MASHLTVLSGTGIGIGSARALNGQPSLGVEATTDRTNAFAAFLGMMGAPANTIVTNALVTAPVTGDILAGIALEADAESTGQDPDENTGAVAAAINAAIPIDTSVPRAGEAKPLLADLLSSLGELKDHIEAGEPLDGAFLSGLDSQLDVLGGALGIDLTAIPGLDELAALARTPVADNASLATKLAGGLIPLAGLLLKGEAVASADTAPLVKTVGEKLAALLGSIGGSDIGADKLAEFGLAADAEPDAELAAIIAKLLSQAPKPDAPVLAKPALQLDEPVLTGKAPADVAPLADAPKDGAVRSEPVVSVDAELQGDSGTRDERGPDPKPLDGKPAPAVAAAVAEARLETQVPGQTQQHAARADAVAAPRVVQTGYQTSQQQLNLPQIAFELARQTTEGNTRFQIRLDPAELGRIDVQLDIDSAGQVNARLVVEKSETLDLMQRDQRGLEKALQQAGLDSAKTNLEFSLKQHNGGDGHGQGRSPQGRNGSGGGQTGEAAEVPPTINLYRASLSASGVNIIA